MDPEEYRRAVYASVVVDYSKTRAERQVVSDVEPVAELSRVLFPANTSFPSIPGELYYAVFPLRYSTGFVVPRSPETIALDWLAKQMGLPSHFLSDFEGGGVIQGSVSEAVVTTMVAARDRYLRDGIGPKYLTEEERETAIAAVRGKLVAFASDQAHSSTHKVSLIAGIKFIAIKTLLKTTMLLSVLKGTSAIYLAASLDYPHIWKHVDAAYSGAALVCPEFQNYLWLLVNFDVSCLYVRKRKDLTDASSITSSYLRNDASDSGLVTDYRDWQGFEIWFVMRTYGAKQEHVRRTLGIGVHFTKLIQTLTDDFSIVTPPRYGLTAFQVVPSKSEETANNVTKRVANRINSEKVLFVTASTVDGKVCSWGVHGLMTEAFEYLESFRSQT
ncbi:pyridoxal phosphate-dependent transferase [Lipomyces kononenkoae]|uniref:Pyridoxal phosphate-dependent transferase n=1 Tax=Lipomyces kononenkoae TaxID=34357 RepID=A0ACC3TAI1_LIPKO